MIGLALWQKTWRECRILFLSLLVIIIAFCWVRVWMTSLVPMANFKTIVRQVPQLERFLPVDLAQLFTYPGRIAVTYDELITVMAVAVWSIGRGSDVVSGELGRGTLEMTLGHPVTRRAIFWNQVGLGLAGVAVLAAGAWLGIAIGIATTTIEEPIAPGLSLLPLPIDLSAVRVPMREKVDR